MFLENSLYIQLLFLGDVKAISTMYLKKDVLLPDINTRDIHQDTPLMRAISSNHVATVSLLLQHGANPSLGNGFEFPIHIASRARKRIAGQIIDQISLAPNFLYTSRNISGFTALEEAVMSSRYGAVRRLIRGQYPQLEKCEIDKLKNMLLNLARPNKSMQAAIWGIFNKLKS